jgi:hypothetical protein
VCSVVLHDIWHANTGVQSQRHPFLFFNTADAKGLATVNGTNGPLAAHRCRLLCPQDCQRRENDGHYFPACLRATGPALEGSDHDDIDPAQIAYTSCTPAEYRGRVRVLYQARTQADFEEARKKAGISKRSIIKGLKHRAHMPDCLTVDTMHVFGLNITELLVMLFRGHWKKKTRWDDSNTWDFTPLKDSEVWKQLGKLIALARRYLPNSFGRPPRNLAEKINSGYKLWEFMIVFWGYFPGMLHEILPAWQYRNFCKLVFTVRRYCTYTVPNPKFLKEAYEAGVEFYREYEERYYQRMPERLDLCRQALHSVMHMPCKVTRTGPLPLTAQWAHERLIGELMRNLRHYKDPQTNFLVNGVEQSQLNALLCLFPELDPNHDELPQTACDLGDGTALLRARSEDLQVVTDAEARAIREAVLAIGCIIQFPLDEPVRVIKWARFKLRNGQIARSFWKEEARERAEQYRQGRNVKVCAG